MMEDGNSIKERVMETITGQMETFILEIGKMTVEWDKEQRLTPMVISMKVNGTMT